MVSIRNFSDVAALSCENVMPAVRATSTKATRLCAAQAALGAAATTPNDPTYFSKSRRETFLMNLSKPGNLNAVLINWRYLASPDGPRRFDRCVGPATAAGE